MVDIHNPSCRLWQGNNFDSSRRQSSFLLKQLNPRIDFKDFFYLFQLRDSNGHKTGGHDGFDIFTGQARVQAIHPHNDGHAAFMRPFNPSAHDATGFRLLVVRDCIFKVEDQGVRSIFGCLVDPFRPITRNKKNRTI
jgi:hypothetical protein